MAWSSSNRRAGLPSNWATIRRRILRRDGHRCQWPLTFGGICGADAHEVDHRADPALHTDANLWALCPPHHGHKTQLEAAAARPARATRRRPAEPHPGGTP